jgi:hypothetical protein
MIDGEVHAGIDRDEVDAVIRDLHSIKTLYVDPAHHHTRARIDVACNIMKILMDEIGTERIKALREAAGVALDHQTCGNDLMDTEIGRNEASKDIHDAIMALVHRKANG